MLKKLNRHKINFVLSPGTKEGFIIKTAADVVKEYDGSLYKYRLSNEPFSDYIIFNCDNKSWVKVHSEFIEKTNGFIHSVACKLWLL